MNNLTCISVNATTEVAIRKLKKENIPLFNCKTEGAKFIFYVKDEHVKKVFVIFAKPCYNIKVVYESKRKRFVKALVNRVGLIVGAVVFLIAAVYSNSLVFKISVVGSGSYLSAEAKRIVYEMGVKEFSSCRTFDYPAATGKILSLPQVTFCNIAKRGSILEIDIEVDDEHYESISNGDLVSDRSGTIKKVVTICGTAATAEGAVVKAGDVLIGAYTLVNEEYLPSIACGYVELECSGRAEYPADCESEENLKNALASVNLQAEEILTRTATATASDGGVVYIIDFTYLHKLSINLN